MKYFKIFLQLKDATKQDVKKVREYITNNSNVVYSTEALGGFDFELECNFVVEPNLKAAPCLP